MSVLSDLWNNNILGINGTKIPSKWGQSNVQPFKGSSPLVTPTTPVPGVIPAPNASVVPPASTTSLFNQGTPTLPVVGSSTLPTHVSNADPKAMLESAKKMLAGGDIPAYSSLQFQNTNPSVVQAETTATELNNARNDLATGTADPYKWASQSGIPFTAAELSAIESAGAGVYDPAIDSALARLDQAQAEHLAKTKASSTTTSNALSAVNPTYTIQAGEDPFTDIAQKNGLTMDELKFINPNIKDWFNVQPGTAINLPSDEDVTTMGVANGSLPMTQLRTILAYSRDSGLKMKIYANAKRLNPNFNPADYELGMGMAKNVGVRKQVSALDNVIAITPELLKVSEESKRTGIPLVNSVVVNGGDRLGIGKNADWKTAALAYADELSGGLGFGSTTDMTREMGIKMADFTQSPEKFQDIVNNVIIPFVTRKRTSLTNQMGIYGNNIDTFSGNETTTTNNDPLGIR